MSGCRGRKGGPVSRRSLRKARYALLDLRDRVNFHLCRPRSIDGPQTLGHRGADVCREVGDQHVIAVEDEAVRPEKTDGRAVLVDPAEAAELCDHRALLRLEDHHVVGLVARDPDVVVLVNDDAVRPPARTIDEDLRGPGPKW